MWLQECPLLKAQKYASIGLNSNKVSCAMSIDLHCGRTWQKSHEYLRSMCSKLSESIHFILVKGRNMACEKHIIWCDQLSSKPLRLSCFTMLTPIFSTAVSLCSYLSLSVNLTFLPICWCTSTSQESGWIKGVPLSSFSRMEKALKNLV